MQSPELGDTKEKTRNKMCMAEPHLKLRSSCDQVANKHLKYVHLNEDYVLAATKHLHSSEMVLNKTLAPTSNEP